MKRSLSLIPLSLGAVALAATGSWPLDTASDYDYDPTEVVIRDGAATLLGDRDGTGADGDLTVSSTSFNLNTDMSGSRTVADGAAWPVTAAYSAGSTSLSLSGYTGGLDEGDAVILAGKGLVTDGMPVHAVQRGTAP